MYTGLHSVFETFKSLFDVHYNLEKPRMVESPRENS